MDRMTLSQEILARLLLGLTTGVFLDEHAAPLRLAVVRQH